MEIDTETEVEESRGFDSFGLSEPIMKAITRAGFSTPSPIQVQAIPVILQGRDIVAQAQTGTGKTAAFGLPAIDLIDKSQPSALVVITPTRELAMQVSDELFRLGSPSGIRTVTICGGKSSIRQLDLIRQGAQVIVATPGRLLDLLQSKRLGNFKPSVVVLDEADEMLNMGFLEDIQEIFKFLPKKRQTLLFSATMPPLIQKLAKDILKEPTFITVTPKTATSNKDIEQMYYLVEEHEREKALIRLIDSYPEEAKAIIFCKMRRDVDRLSSALISAGYSARGLHGEMEQNSREEVMKSFRSGQIGILIATDVAARGINVIDVTHVINFHIPTDAESYVHRIGRTGRAGRIGVAISLISPPEQRRLMQISKIIGANIKSAMIPTLQDVKRAKMTKFMSEAKEQVVASEALDMVKQMQEEMDLMSIASKLVSLLMKNETLSGPDQIGLDPNSYDERSERREKRPAKKHFGGYEKRNGPPRRGGGAKKPGFAPKKGPRQIKWR